MKYIAAFLSLYVVWFVTAFIVSVVVAVLFPAAGPIAAGIVISPDWRTWPGVTLGFLSGIYSAKLIFTRMARLSSPAMSTLKTAATLLVLYAVIFTLDSTVNVQLRGGTTFWGRVLTYVPVILILSWGLWQAKRWAWIGSLIFTAVFGVMGLLTLIAGISVSNSNYQVAHHWTIMDWLVVIIMNIVFIVTFILLLLPSSKRALQEAS